MKYIITVEITKDDRPVKPKDLRGQMVAKFPRVAPKLFKKAIRLLCWPFGANIKVEFVEEDEKPRKNNK
jgi:hypothetical protein